MTPRFAHQQRRVVHYSRARTSTCTSPRMLSDGSPRSADIACFRAAQPNSGRIRHAPTILNTPPISIREITTQQQGVVRITTITSLPGRPSPTPPPPPATRPARSPTPRSPSSPTCSPASVLQLSNPPLARTPPSLPRAPHHPTIGVPQPATAGIIAGEQLSVD